MPTAKVTKRGADRIRHGHLWIYRSDVVDVEAKGGSVVTVKDERGNFIGKALFSNASQIALRFLTQSNEEIDRDWWRRRIREAVARRHAKVSFQRIVLPKLRGIERLSSEIG